MTVQKNVTLARTCEFVRDARKFVTAFGTNPVSRSTPYIYISVLPLWPPGDPVWQNYWGRARRLIKIEGSAMKRRDVATAAVWATPASIRSLVISFDGTCVASGGDHYVVHIWDTHSGSLAMEPLEGYSNRVTSVAFSPNGARVVSRSYDRTIRIWDAQTGSDLFGALEGHDDWVLSVAWSPDGARIASGSSDGTIRIWDVQSGTVAGSPLEGHTEDVQSVAFSPDGRYLASGSSDCTVRIWDAQSG
jgi:WD40 repeat protein